MDWFRRFASGAFLLASCTIAGAQHCAPVYASYLSEVSIKQVDGKLRFRFEYTIQGGRGQDAYQAYLLAYLEKDAARVPAPAPAEVLDKDAALILSTQVIKRNKTGTFDLEFQVDADEFAKQVIAHKSLTDKDRDAHGGWGVYRDRIRVAVFIPLLDDKKYSVLDGLPEDRHYCNYENDRALLFQELPFRLSIHFGIVRARSTAAGTCAIEINGDRPDKSKQ